MLTSKERAALRSRANELETIVHVGKGGITENLIKQANDALAARELIKCRVLETSMLSAREACDALACATNSQPVQVIGSRFVLFRKNEKPKKKGTVNPVKAGIKARARKVKAEKLRKKKFFSDQAKNSGK